MASQTVLADSRLKSMLVLVPALAITTWIASQFASEEIMLPATITGLFVLLVFFTVFVQVVRFEAAIIGLLLIGYLVGNRGFADLAIAKPFYFGEVGLAAITLATILRYIVARETLDISGMLARLILVYLFLGLARFIVDVREYKLDAVRDSALVYYAIFFFASRQVGQQASSRRFLEGCLKYGFLCLTAVSFLHRLYPDVLASASFGGRSVFEQKDDLTTTFAAVAVFYIYSRPKLYRYQWARIVFILFFLVFVANGIGRASLLALAIGSIPLWIARERKFFIYPAVAVALGLTLLAGFSVQFENSDTSRATVALEKVKSIVDFSGNQSYQSDFGQLKASNNEFRRVLWQFFIDDTVKDSPVFGRGFGYDFVPGFTDVYHAGEWLGLRSAHNYYITVFGRLGLLGLGLFAAITWQIIVGGVRAALAVRHGRLGLPVLSYWCGAWALLVCATVGVVFEGPIGGIVFWSILGLAVSGMDLARKEHAEEQLELDAPPELPDEPVDLQRQRQPRRSLTHSR